MAYADTTVIPVRLSRLAIELIDQQAKRCRMSRSAWMRTQITFALQEQQQLADIEALEQRLKLQFEAAISKINAHITKEIDSLVEGADH